MTSKTRLTLDLKNSESYDNLILHRGDSKSRVIEIEITDNHAPVTLTSGMSATINASTNGIVVADGEKATVDTANNIISFTVTDNMTSLPGQSKISLTVKEGDTVITAQTFRAIVTDSVINEGSKFEPTGGTVKQFMDEVAAARGDYTTLLEAMSKKADKSTTLAGYGITDGENIGNKVSVVNFQNLSATDYPSIKALNNYHTNYVEPCYDEIGNLEESKADKSTVDTALSGKLDNAAGSVTTDNIASKAVTSDKIANGAITAMKIATSAVSGNNIAQNQINANHLQNGTVTTDKLADDVKSIINGKYNSSNIETGRGELTVHTQSAIDSGLIKSCTFDYQKTGKLVNIFFEIVFNAGSINYLQFAGLPFKGNSTSDQNRYVSVTNKNTQAAVYLLGSWLILNFNATKAFVQDETLKGAVTIKIS